MEKDKNTITITFKPKYKGYVKDIFKSRFMVACTFLIVGLFLLVYFLFLYANFANNGIYINLQKTIYIILMIVGAFMIVFSPILPFILAKKRGLKGDVTIRITNSNGWHYRIFGRNNKSDYQEIGIVKYLKIGSTAVLIGKNFYDFIMVPLSSISEDDLDFLRYMKTSVKN